MGCGSSTATNCDTLSPDVSGIASLDITSHAVMSYSPDGTKLTINLNSCQIVNSKYVYAMIIGGTPTSITDLTFNAPILSPIKIPQPSVTPPSNGFAYVLSLASNKSQIVINLVPTTSKFSTIITPLSIAIVASDTNFDSQLTGVTSYPNLMALDPKLHSLTKNMKTYSIRVPLASASAFTNPTSNDVQGYYESNKLVGKDYHPF